MFGGEAEQLEGAVRAGGGAVCVCVGGGRRGTPAHVLLNPGPRALQRGVVMVVVVVVVMVVMVVVVAMVVMVGCVPNGRGCRWPCLTPLCA